MSWEETMITIKIPWKTPTCNHLYWHRGNIKIMTKEARELKKKIKDICYDTLQEQMYLLDGKKLKVTIEIHEDWYCKNGTVKRKDISNREKFLVDAIFDSVDWEDKFIFEHTMKKIQDKKEFAIIKIETLKATKESVK